MGGVGLHLLLAVLLSFSGGVAACPCCVAPSTQTSKCATMSAAPADCCQICPAVPTRLSTGEQFVPAANSAMVLIVCTPPSVNVFRAALPATLAPSPPGALTLAPLRV